MPEIIVNIAGTSSGGSSYIKRLMDAISDAKGEYIEVCIQKGDKQVQVYAIVMRQVLELYEFVSMFGGVPQFNLHIRME